jgi:hypothetical protein
MTPKKHTTKSRETIPLNKIYAAVMVSIKMAQVTLFGSVTDPGLFGRIRTFGAGSGADPDPKLLKLTQF